MDMQMPELDGLAATRALRADPRFTTIPIIAMTANAMKVDLDACLAAGMNDHITKPIDRRTLVATLRRWLPARPAEPSAAREMQAPPPASTLPAEPTTAAEAGPVLEGVDVSGTLRRLEIDRASLDRMLLRFADGARETLDGLRTAVVAGRVTEAARHAHAIAGAAGNLGADALRDAAKTLEQAGREGRSDLAQMLAVVEACAAVVFRSVETLRPSADRDADLAVRPFDPALARAALDRLTVALENYDTTSVNGALSDLGSSGLPGWAADDLGRLHGCIDGYEYGKAQGIAARLLARVHEAVA
jgi:HPt (histidine-containing phosphotransfer) domain-containing protein